MHEEQVKTGEDHGNATSSEAQNKEHGQMRTVEQVQQEREMNQVRQEEGAESSQQQKQEQEQEQHAIQATTSVQAGVGSEGGDGLQVKTEGDLNLGGGDN